MKRNTLEKWNPAVPGLLFVVLVGVSLLTGTRPVARKRAVAPRRDSGACVGLARKRLPPEPGQWAVGILVPIPVRDDGWLPPGVRVDVLGPVRRLDGTGRAHPDQQQGQEVPATVIVRNRLLLFVGSECPGDPAAPAVPVRVVTLSALPEEAIRLEEASRAGGLRLSLRALDNKRQIIALGKVRSLIQPAGLHLQPLARQKKMTWPVPGSTVTSGPT
jgi:hypothetical protein